MTRSCSSAEMICGFAPRPATSRDSRSTASLLALSSGVKIHGRPANRSGRANANPPRSPPPSGCPPTKVRPGASARAAFTISRVQKDPPYPVDRLEKIDVLAHGRGEDDQRDGGQRTDRLEAALDGAGADRVCQHRFGVDAEHARRGPALTNTQSDRPANQAQPDYCDGGKRNVGRVHVKSQNRFGHWDLGFVTEPTRVEPRARDKC